MKPKAVIGVSDHAGWAVLMTIGADRSVLDRRRIELVEPGVPVMPHHHDALELPIEEGVALVERVRASAARCAEAALQALADEVPAKIVGIALRKCPPLPPTVAERLTNYFAQNNADWVMYREVLAEAATARRWKVFWYDAKTILDDADRALLRRIGAELGPPWQKDQQIATAAALAHAPS